MQRRGGRQLAPRGLVRSGRERPVRWMSQRAQHQTVRRARPIPRRAQVSSVPASVKELGGDVSDVVAKALADKAVVVEGGKPLDGFKVRRPEGGWPRTAQQQHACQEQRREHQGQGDRVGCSALRCADAVPLALHTRSPQYVSKAVAARVLQARRAEVHERYVKYWAKKVLVSPEIAAVPLKLVDAQLASKFEVRATCSCSAPHAHTPSLRAATRHTVQRTP